MPTIGSVLLVDDDTELRKALTKILSNAGHLVVAQPDAASAVNYIATTKTKFDVIITDVWMPGLNGVRFMSVIKKALPNRPVIVITAFGDAALRDEAMRGGAFDFFTKPIDRQKFLEGIERAILSGRGGAPGQPAAPTPEEGHKSIQAQQPPTA